MNRRRTALLAGGAILLFASILIRLHVGSLPLAAGKLRAYLFLGGAGLSELELGVIGLRLHHALLVALVGAGLAVAGCVYQGALRNQLADPYILGVSSGAALAAGLALSYDLSVARGLGLAAGFSAGRDLPVAAFLGALASIAVLLVVHRLRPGSILTLVLGGVAVNGFFSAALTIVLYHSRNLRGVYGWLLGSIEAGDPTRLAVTAAVVLAATALLCARAGVLNVMTLDRRVAATLGIDADRETIWFVVVASVIVAAVVAVSGMIGFVGLLAPHAARLLIGADHKYLLPFSFIVGGLTLSACDAAGRALFPEALPVGVITSFVGAPVFVYLLARRG